MLIIENKYYDVEKRSISKDIAKWVFMDTEDIDNCLSIIEEIIGDLDFEDYESPETLEDALFSYDLETLYKIEYKLFE